MTLVACKENRPKTSQKCAYSDTDCASAQSVPEFAYFAQIVSWTWRLQNANWTSQKLSACALVCIQEAVSPDAPYMPWAEIFCFSSSFECYLNFGASPSSRWKVTLAPVSFAVAYFLLLYMIIPWFVEHSRKTPLVANFYLKL